VHATVVLVPVAVILGIVGTLWPAARRKLGIVTPITASVAGAAVALTILAGQWLKEHIVTTDLAQSHENMGTRIVPWIILLVIGTWLQWAWYSFGQKRVARGQKVIPITLIALVSVGAIGTLVAIFLIAEAGARAVWAPAVV
jgi:hypothetical protein